MLDLSAILNRAKTLARFLCLTGTAIVGVDAYAQVESVPRLAQGETRVYFSAGYHVGSGWRPNLKSVQIVVNEKIISSLTEGQFSIVDFKAGNYTIGCFPQDANANFPVARQITFKAGTYKYFSCDMDAFTESTRAKDAAMLAIFSVPLGVVGGAVGGAVAGAATGAASSTDFKTKTYLEERPLASGSQYTTYTKASDILSNTETGNSSITNDPVKQLKDLQELKKQGLITDSEYRKLRKDILDQM